MRLFKHPSIVDGKIHFEDQAWDVRAGVVECPAGFGAANGWVLPTADELQHYCGEDKTAQAESNDRPKRTRK